MIKQMVRQPGLRLLVALLAGCTTSLEDASSKSKSAGLQSSQNRPIRIDGSSTVFPLTEAIADKIRFQEGKDAPEIAIEISGIRDGFKKFCTGVSDINSVSRPILKAEMETCKANLTGQINPWYSTVQMLNLAPTTTE